MYDMHIFMFLSDKNCNTISKFEDYENDECLI